MQKYKIARIILLFAVSVQMLSCSKTAGDDPAGMDASLALSLLTRNGNGDLALTGEDEFTSLAVYIFNHDNGDLEFSELVTDFTPESAANSYVRSVRVTKDKKAIYAVANYAGKNFTANGQAVTIDENTPKSTLDALEIVSSSFSADDIAMIGKTATTMSGTAVNASVEMERLVGRVDMHVFKSAELTDDLVELTSIEFRNQVVRSNVQYQSKAMPGGDIRRTETYTPAAAGYLDVVPDDADYAALKPSDAEKSFYSYQNISGEEDPSGAAPDDASTPYLLVNVKERGPGNLSRRSEEYRGILRLGTQPDLPGQSGCRSAERPVVPARGHPEMGHGAFFDYLRRTRVRLFGSGLRSELRTGFAVRPGYLRF